MTLIDVADLGLLEIELYSLWGPLRPAGDAPRRAGRLPSGVDLRLEPRFRRLGRLDAGGRGRRSARHWRRRLERQAAHGLRDVGALRRLDAAGERSGHEEGQAAKWEREVSVHEMLSGPDLAAPRPTGITGGGRASPIVPPSLKDGGT